MYYDKQGEKINDTLEWAKLFEDKEYKRIAETTIGKHWISTVWLGLDHNYDGGKPLIFETMVFLKNKNGKTIKSDLDMDRYSTLEEAKDGHIKMVNKWTNQ
jgi:hypothetical protein